MKNFKKSLAILIFISMGSLAACGDDRGSDGNNGSDNNTDTGKTETDSTSQLKDLTPAEVAALCQKTTKKEADFYNPTTETGKAYCLLDSAFDAFDEEDDDDVNIEYCEEYLGECIAYIPAPYDECMTPTDCTATVAEFEKCQADNIELSRELLKPYRTKTCSNTATEAGIDDVYDIYFSDDAASCEALYAKCPNINDFLIDDTEED